jgi:hypothetical protein
MAKKVFNKEKAAKLALESQPRSFDGMNPTEHAMATQANAVARREHDKSRQVIFRKGNDADTSELKLRAKNARSRATATEPAWNNGHNAGYFGMTLHNLVGREEFPISGDAMSVGADDRNRRDEDENDDW